MFSENTVLILGAGASAPYGFPSGRRLALDISYSIRTKEPYRDTLARVGFNDFVAVKTFGDLLQKSLQPSIDAFLESRPKFIPLGKTCIALTLIPIEISARLGRKPEDPMRWYEYLFHNIGPRIEDISSSPFSVITFNYDRSFEYSLFFSIKSSFDIEEDLIRHFFMKIGCVHVYGDLAPPLFLNPAGRDYKTDIAAKEVEKARDSIRVMTDDDGEPNLSLSKARNIITEANAICFIGFGYHKVNLDRILKGIDLKGKAIFGSAFGMESNEVRIVKEYFFERKANITLGAPDQNALMFLRNQPIFS